MIELPGWAWVVVGWLLACACLTLGLCRWFRYMSDDTDHDNWRRGG